MEEITVSDEKARSAYITYLYNRLAEEVLRAEGSALLHFDDRAALHIKLNGDPSRVQNALQREIGEVLGVGYKNKYLEERLAVSLSKREAKLLRAADRRRRRGRRRVYPPQDHAIFGIRDRRDLSFPFGQTAGKMG